MGVSVWVRVNFFCGIIMIHDLFDKKKNPNISMVWLRCVCVCVWVCGLVF